MGNLANYFMAGFLGIFSGANLANGLYGLSELYSIRDSARDAVYAKAEEITPEVIAKANEAARGRGKSELINSIIFFGVAASTGACALTKATERAKEQ